MKLFIARILSVAAVVALCSCTSPSGGEQKPLVVGMTPDIAPVVYKQAGKWAGLEVDLARKLGRTLGRSVQVVDLAWDDQIPALLDGRIDIIMSGMSVTEARKVRIVFATPWMEGGLMALIRAKDKNVLKTPADLAASKGNIGVIPGTTGEAFVLRNYNSARSVTVDKPEDVYFLMQRRSIDSFVHDAPSILWQVSRNEGALAVIPELLDHEQIAWGLRRDDPELLASVNAAIAAWKTDGSLDAIIRRWIPHYDRFLTAAPAAAR